MYDITPSGYRIVGRRGDSLSAPVGEVAFWIELPAGVRYGLRHYGTNTMRLVGNGSTALGGTMTVRTDRLPGANPVTPTVIGLGSASPPLFGGTLLVDLALPNVVVNHPVNAGSSSFNLPAPHDPALIGAFLLHAEPRDRPERHPRHGLLEWPQVDRDGLTTAVAHRRRPR